MNWLALDIGGANLKLADGLGYAASYAFHMWKDFHQLARELRMVITEAPASDHLAVTMTGELADCFETKTEGVQFILQALETAADGRYARVYLNDGRMVTPQVAMDHPLAAASSNWHALARFAGRYTKRGSALLIDVGSTTCDIIPMVDGKPEPFADNDTDRLLHGELVYTGIERSPVCSLIEVTPYRGSECPIAQEVFATTRDVYLTLGRLREDEKSTNTADGRPSTKAAARTRLGRLISASGERFHSRDAAQMAEVASAAQVRLLSKAVQQVTGRLPEPPQTIILSGHGEFLAKKVVKASKIDGKTVSLEQELGTRVSRCAPAHGLAVLAREASGL